jgi:hypothetical protein
MSNIPRNWFVVAHESPVVSDDDSSVSSDDESSVVIEDEATLKDKYRTEVLCRIIFGVPADDERIERLIGPDNYRRQYIRSVECLRDEDNNVRQITRNLVEPLAEIKELINQLNLVLQA